MSNKIIALVGPKQAGKTTVSEYLKEKYNAKVVALADKLKIASSKAFDVPLEHFEFQDLKEVEFTTPKIITHRILDIVLSEFGIFGNRDMFYVKHLGIELLSPRHVAQYVGTEILRDYDEDIHLKNVSLYNKITVISDVRFVSEYEYLLNKGATFLYVKRTEAEKLITDASHASEKESQLIKNMNRVIIINNDNSLDQTYKQLDKTMELLNEN